MVRLAAILVTLGACGTARIIEQTQVGGTIELTGDRGKAMDQANRDMAAQCGPNNSTITSSGYELRGGSGADPVYRVHYQCNGALRE